MVIEAYRQSLQAVPIPRERQEQPDAPLTAKETGQLRSGTGVLQSGALFWPSRRVW